MSQTKFLDKTLLAVARVAEQSLFSEQYARGRGLLQALDIRIKLVTFLFILVLISVLRSHEALWLLYGASLALAVASRIPVVYFLGRVWLFVPLFSAFIVLPALLNIVTPGEPLWIVFRLRDTYSWGPYTIPREIAITRQGLWGGVLLVSRVATSVSFAVLFTLTSRWSDIFAGLRAVFAPRIFVMTLSMTYRYMFVFLRLVQDMYRGRKSRTIRPLSASGDRTWVASRIGFLFIKSAELSNDIYLAMLSRGYHGEALTLSRFRASVADYIWLSLIFLLGGILLLLERGPLRWRLFSV